MPLADIPRIGTGTVVRDARQFRHIGETVSTFLNAGGRLIDTAPSYKVQPKLASALAKWPRDVLWVTSKIPLVAMGYEPTLRQVNATLEELRTPWVDLMLIHRPNNSPGPKGDKEQQVTRRLRLSSFRALLDARAAGLVRHVGVSNYGVAYLNELAEAGLPMPFANELEFHPFIETRQWALVRRCQALGIRIIAYNSLGGLGALRDAPPTLAAIAAAHRATPAQVMLRL